MLVSYIMYENNAFDDIVELRREVFSKEQGISPEVITDESDKKAEHVALYEKDLMVACGRVTLVKGVATLGRIAVRREFRGQGLGKTIVTELLRTLRRPKAIVCEAQITAAGFYEKLGFTREGGEFVKEGLPHVRMVYKK